MCGRGRAGVQQERTAQYGGRMFVFATTQGVQGDMPSAIARAPGEKSNLLLNPRVSWYPWFRYLLRPGTTPEIHQFGAVT